MHSYRRHKHYAIKSLNHPAAILPMTIWTIAMICFEKAMQVYKIVPLSLNEAIEIPAKSEDSSYSVQNKSK